MTLRELNGWSGLHPAAIERPEEIDHNRRRFFGTAAFTLAATQLGMVGFATRSPQVQHEETCRQRIQEPEQHSSH